MKPIVRIILASSLALAVAGLSGCFSIELDGEFRADASQMAGFKDGIEVISFDSIEPFITTNETGCWVQFYAVGDFVVDDGKVVEVAYDKYMAIGVLPSYAGHKHPKGEGPGFFLAAVLHANIVTLGLPTLCGIFVNPFVDIDWVNRISSAGFAGVWRYGAGNARIVKRMPVEGRGPKPFRKILLKDFAISVNGGTWIRDQDGMFPIGRRQPDEVMFPIGRRQPDEVSITIVKPPTGPNEICSRLQYKDWHNRKFTIPNIKKK